MISRRSLFGLALAPLAPAESGKHDRREWRTDPQRAGLWVSQIWILG